MKRNTTIVGIFLLLGFVSDAHAQSVYDRLHQFTLDEHAEERSDILVERFVTKIYPRKYLPNFTNTDVDLALQDQYAEICRPDDPERHPIDNQECTGYRHLVENMVDKSEWLHQFVRDLQISAASFEAGLDYYSGRYPSVVSRFPSIVKIWQADTDVVQSPIAEEKVRGGVYEIDMSSYWGPVEGELQGLIQGAGGKEDREQFASAVWRYRHGVKYVEAEGSCPTSNDRLGDGTDLQFLDARFCDLEDKLNDIYNVVQGFSIAPPLKPNEKIIYPIKMLDSVEVYIWVRADDVGLWWNVHLDPVVPSYDCSGSRSYFQPPFICEDDAIHGGTYPPELDDPEEDEGICSHPFAARGYLCRHLDTIRCPVNPGSAVQEDDIHLIGCRTPDMESPYRWTEAGPNICNEGGWRVETQGLSLGVDTPGRDISSLAPDWCSNCFVDTFCGACGAASEGFTKPKELSGRIEVCLNPTEPAMSTYLYIHEMVHVQQNCDSPIGQSIIRDIIGDPAGCCATEYQAYMVQCDALGEDGVLEKIFDEQGIDIQTCAAALTNFSCGGAGSCSQLPPDLNEQDILDEITEYVRDHAGELGVATSCADAVNNMDTRVKKMKDSLPQVCTPKCKTKYANTIGNNACMVGQCVEESFERHRMIPGRMTFTVQDQAFPWDADSEMDPNFGAFFLTPPKITAALPPYRPALLARQVDNFLCQINSLPTKVPPVLCAFDPRRRLRLPTKDFLLFWESLIDQPDEQQSMQALVQGVVPGVGTRLGTQVYKQYLGHALDAFEDLILGVNDMLRSIEQAEFPDEMCRRNADNP